MTFVKTAYANDAALPETVDIIFTHDIHSYLASYTSDFEGQVQEIGGVARLATVIKEKQKENPQLLLLDGGDLSMGTLYQTLVPTHALELRMLGRLGFDATTFGNHDFDYSQDKLISMFNAAADSKDALPAFTVSNIDWNKDDEDTRSVYEAALRCNLCEYTVVEKNGVKIAIFGIFGDEAALDSPTLTLTVKDQIESARATVEKIKKNESVDMIVCISHSGTNADLGKSEDEQLALAVPDIDVIISAHSHTVIQSPIVHGTTTIASCGSYGRYTGYMRLTRDNGKDWSVTTYELIPMDSSIKEDEEVASLIGSYKEVIDEEYLKNFSLTSDQILAYNNMSMESVDDMEHDFADHRLGNFLSDAYRYAVNNTEYGKENPVDIAVVPAGTIRGTFNQGNITTLDAFQSYSLGMGYDGLVGNPLICFYLSGKEIKMIPEIDASISPMMTTAVLYCSGLSYKINPCRMLLNKAYDIALEPQLMSEGDFTEKIDDNKLYSVVSDLYTARMLGSISPLSHGLISIVPKNDDGTKVEFAGDDYNWESGVVRDDEGDELKVWYAVATYLSSFDKNENGISVIPEYYNSVHGRKIVEKSYNPIKLLCQPNDYSKMVYFIIIVLIIVVLLVVKYFIQRRKKKNE